MLTTARSAGVHPPPVAAALQAPLVPLRLSSTTLAATTHRRSTTIGRNSTLNKRMTAAASPAMQSHRGSTLLRSAAIDMVAR